MTQIAFLERITRAAGNLHRICPSASPSENQIRQVVRDVGLPLSSEDNTFIVDPIRTAVVVNAYNLCGIRKAAETLETTWKWYLEHNATEILTC